MRGEQAKEGRFDSNVIRLKCNMVEKFNRLFLLSLKAFDDQSLFIF